MQPIPFPHSLFNSSILEDDAVRWGAHSCTSFKCLQDRQVGDCRGCFNFDEEWRRWTTPNEQKIVTLSDVMQVTQGRLRCVFRGFNTWRHFGGPIFVADEIGRRQKNGGGN